mgnify:FL=1
MDLLKAEGKEPVAKDVLTMLVMVGASTDRHFLSMVVGIGSRSHCLLGLELMRRTISSIVAG